MPARDDRHVRFAEENHHYTYPTTPSPSYSEISLPSSPGLSTPPQTTFVFPPTPHPRLRSLPGSPTPTTPCSLDTESVVLHPALVTRTGITFDMRADPQMTKPSPQLTPIQLAEPATLPQLPQLTIKCRGLPWAIIIRPASSKPEAFVTVADVITGIYRQLHEAVKTPEFERIPSDDERDRVRDAWSKRCYQVRGATDVHRRVDFLMDKTMFCGLSTTEEAQFVFKMSISSRPPP